MGYSVNSGPFVGRYSGCDDVNLSPQGSLTATATSKVLELGGPKPCRLTVASQSVSAGGTVDVVIQGSDTNDFSGDVRTLATFTQITAANAKQSLSFLGARFVRASMTVAGTTPSIDITIKGEVCF